MFLKGQQIGRYTLIKKIGVGGFGEVWLAEYESDYGISQVAIKLPRSGQVDWKEITQEIGLWVIAGKHPNILPFIEAKIYNGQIAIVSEYAPDGSLENLLKQKGALPIEQAVEITIGILEGLAHLHSNGIIHRDLKPANILLHDNTPRLADFGISRIASEDSYSQTIAGTSRYMAPEAFDGKRNVQTDIWSVGVILYQLLADKLPFPQKDTTELLGAILLSKPKYLPELIPSQLNNLVSKALNQSPLERYQTATEMHQEMQNFLAIFLDNVSSQKPRERVIYQREWTPLQLARIASLRASMALKRKKELIKYKLEKASETGSIGNLLIPYCKGDKWGFCDENKQILIEPKYEDISLLSNGLMGKLSGLTMCKFNGKWGLVDENGGEITRFKYDRFFDWFSEGIAVIELNNKWGFIDKLGREIIPPIYEQAHDFSEGFAAIRKIFNESKRKFGFINKFGEEVIPARYEFAFRFSESLARIALNEKWKWGFINCAGDEIIECMFDSAGDFSEGFAKVKLNSKWGYIDINGDEIIPFIYEDVSDFSHGIASAKINDKWGLIDQVGREIIPFKYENSVLFSENLAKVKLNNKWGFIDFVNTQIIPFHYENALDFSENLAGVQLKGKWSYIDKKGKTIIHFKYKEAWEFLSGIARVTLNGKKFYIDKNGTEYFED